jgi:hypothetical protein
MTKDQAATLRLRAEQLAQAALSMREVAAEHRQEIAALRAHCVRQNRSLRDMQRTIRLLQRPPRYARLKAWAQAQLADMGFGFKSETHTGASRPHPEGAL